MLPRLGVNIDHIATLRQLRGTPYPDLLEAAELCEAAGADQITVHLREDRRHIHDADVKNLRAKLKLPLNLEMAATDAMKKFALKIIPQWVCIVPEKRQEVTTEGGLNLVQNKKKIGPMIRALKRSNIKVSLFIEPTLSVIEMSAALGADAVEIHTGRYCLATQVPQPKKAQIAKELSRIEKAALLTRKLGMACHAGHGFDYSNVRAVAALCDGSGQELIAEYNIGHAIVCRAVLVGLPRAVREMQSMIQAP